MYMNFIKETETDYCHNTARNICFIPVRKNSKEIKGKNMKELAGKPLIAHILETIIVSGIADEIWVATDWDYLKKYVRETFGRKVQVYNRNPENATDTSPTIDVVQEFLDKRNYAFSDNFILLQATSPFTTSEELSNLKTILRNDTYDSIVSCCRLKRFRWSENGTSLDYDLKTKQRRQEYNGFLIESGSFYVSKAGLIKGTRQLLSGRIFPFEVSYEAFIELDNPLDWELAETVIRYKRR